MKLTTTILVVQDWFCFVAILITANLLFSLASENTSEIIVQLEPEYISGLYPCDVADDICPDGFNFRPILPSETFQFAIVYALTSLTQPYIKKVTGRVKATRRVWNYDIVFLVYSKITKNLILSLKTAMAPIPGVKIHEVDLPFDPKLLSPKFLQYQEKNHNCCGITEYIKLHAVSLPYSKVLVLDLDITIVKRFDHLLLSNDDLMFTSGPESPLNMGVVVMKSGMAQRLEEMVTTLVNVSFVYTNEKWYTGLGLKPASVKTPMSVEWTKRNGNNSKSFHGAEGPQGFLYFYYVVDPNQHNFKVRLISRCLYQRHGCYSIQSFVQNGAPIMIHKGRKKLPAFHLEPKQCNTSFWVLVDNQPSSIVVNFDQAKFEAHNFLGHPLTLLKKCWNSQNKFIVMLEEPIQRCWKKLNAKHVTKKDQVLAIHLTNFLQKEKGTFSWLERPIPDFLFERDENYIYEGIYVAHLRRWFFYLSRENFLILFPETVASEPIQTEIVAFLQIQQNANMFSQAYEFKKAHSHPEVNPHLNSQLQSVYEPYNERLQSLFARKLPWL